MLFDLRSKGRRRTVRGVYLGLALLMGGGLVLFGVGTGNGIGGLLNGIGGTSNSSQPAITQAEKSALRQTERQPNNPAGWEALVKARYEAASQDASQTTTTTTYTAAGVKELKSAGQAYQRYLQLAKPPDWTLAELMAQAYDSLGDYADETDAWQVVTAAQPTTASYFEYLAVSAWKAKESRLGDLAEAKALALTPKSQRADLKTELSQAKSSATSSTSSTSTTTAGAG